MRNPDNQIPQKEAVNSQHETKRQLIFQKHPFTEFILKSDSRLTMEFPRGIGAKFGKDALENFIKGLNLDTP